MIWGSPIWYWIVGIVCCVTLFTAEYIQRRKQKERESEGETPK